MRPTSNISPGLSGRLVMTMASLNSDKALGLDAVKPPLVSTVLRPCSGWNVRSVCTCRHKKLGNETVQLDKNGQW